MIAHTSGPWRSVDGEIEGDGEIIGVVFRAEAWTSGEPITQSDQANAALIAAAPDMLAALIVWRDAEDGAALMLKARKLRDAAIAKATEGAP
jgi:hypothetical protein